MQFCSFDQSSACIARKITVNLASFAGNIAGKVGLRRITIPGDIDSDVDKHQLGDGANRTLVTRSSSPAFVAFAQALAAAGPVARAVRVILTKNVTFEPKHVCTARVTG